MFCHGSKDGSLIEFEEAPHESVRMPGFDAKRRKPGGRKVVQVLGHDQIGVRGDCRSKHMAVIGIREIESLDERLVAGDQAVPNTRIHHCSRTFEVRLQSGALAKNCTYPFIVNAIRPLRAEQIGEGKPHEQIPQRCGIQHTGIVQHRDGRHCPTRHSVAQPELLSLLGHLLENVAPRLILLPLIGHEIAVEDSAMRADLAEGQFSFFEQADQERS